MTPDNFHMAGYKKVIYCLAFAVAVFDVSRRFQKHLLIWGHVPLQPSEPGRGVLVLFTLRERLVNYPMRHMYHPCF